MAKKTISFVVNVAAAGTAVALSTGTGAPGTAQSLIFQAEPSNTGTNMFLGGSDVDSTLGIKIAKTAAPFQLPVLSLDGDSRNYNLSEIYVDSDTSGDDLLVLAVVEV